MKAGKTCANCAHFNILGQDCRKNAPTAFLVTTPQGITTMGSWPATNEAQWCGQHEAEPVSLQ